MAWSLIVCPNVSNRLHLGDQGLLIAAVDAPNQTVTVISSVPVAAAGGFPAAADELAALLPQGLHVVGTYTTGDACSTAWQPSSTPFVCASNAAADSPHWSVNGKATTAAAAGAANGNSSGEDVDLPALPGFVPFRCHLDVQLNVVHQANSISKGSSANLSNGSSNSSASLLPDSAIEAAVQQLQQDLLNQQLVLVSEQSSVAEGQAPVIISSSSQGTVGEAFGSVATTSSGSPCVTLLPLQQSSSSSSKPPAPMFEYDPSQQQQQVVTPVTLGLDVLCYAPASLALSGLLQSLVVPALQSQLATMQQQLVKQAAAVAAAGNSQSLQQPQQSPLVPVRAHHFSPPGLGVPVTVCYPLLHQSPETTELKLMPTRKGLHQLLGLPDNVPMLKFANALSWVNAGAAAAAGAAAGVLRAVRLRNVHEGLTPPGFGGQLYLIDGIYEYYHYMQDKFNDNGWGCAYRSLQTIMSWFRLQKYTSKPVLGHRQIQELLVSLGIEKPSLIGSSKWLGSFDLNNVLDAYLGITCKVIDVSRGSDIPSKARALAQHFATQGTPVMIGGGVLAYTLLGVSFNEDTGEVAFLILDPHYTGGEDLKAIQQGSWVAWKQLGDNAAAGGPLFVKDAFYNFLCPQRPQSC